MRTGKVVPTDLLGIKNKIFHSGDTIQEDQVPPGNWEKLVKAGYINPDPEKADKAEKGKSK